MDFANNKFGVVYAASGNGGHIKHAIKSATSIRRFYPDLKLCLFSDRGVDRLQREGLNISPFNTIKVIEEQHSRNKFDAMLGTPYDKTLYLDNDTVVKKPVLIDMFRVLENFEMALTHAPLVRVVTPLKEIPPTFTELNGGVVLYNKTERVMKLLKQWEHNWKNKTIKTRKGHKDQPYLRKLIWESDLRIYILPAEYNVRKKVASKVFIHHRRGVEL